MSRSLRRAVLAVAVLAFVSPPLVADDLEANARAAVAGGRLKEGFALYMQAFENTPVGSDDEFRLRSELAKLAPRLDHGDPQRLREIFSAAARLHSDHAHGRRSHR